jgi:uncharacterized membrane protein YhhN
VEEYLPRPQRARLEKRPWLLASLIAGISYYFIRHGAVPDIYEWAWKGAGVALLAVYALVRHQDADARQIAAVMAFGALGDVLIELQLELGAGAFLIGHLIAIRLYLRHRRAKLAGSQRALALALVLLTPLVSWRLTGSVLAGVYALGLGAMAGAAWTSSFPRYRVGLGAVMFVASDLLIFAGLGPLTQSAVPDLLIWPLYYFGQFLVCTGVVGELRHRARPQ